MGETVKTQGQSVNRWLITFTVMLGAFISSLDTSIVNVAIPYMRGNVGASVEEITWVSTGYILSNVIIMPIIGMLSVRFGRKNFYVASIIIFTATSFFCGLAWDLTSVVLFRIIQGIGGGAMVPIAQAILREIFPPEEQGMAMGLYGFGVVLGPAIGPVVGGWLTDNFSWRWIFYVNVPIGIVNVLLAIKYIHDPVFLKREKNKIDFLGLGLLIVGLGSLQVMLEKGEYKSWFESSFIRTLAAISAIGIILFIWRELTTDKPAVNLRIVKNVNFSIGSFIVGIMGLGLYGSLFVIPLFLQQLLGYPAYDAGLAMMPRSIAMAVVMPIAGRYYNKLGPKFFIGSGFIIASFSLYQLSTLSLDVGYWDIFFPQFIQGAGFGLIFVALSTATLSTIEKRQLTDAAGLYNVIRQVFASVGIALVANELSNRTTYNRVMLTSHINDYSNTTSSWLAEAKSLLLGKGFDMQRATDGALKLVDGEVMRQASMLAYNHIFFLVMCLFIITIPVVFLIRSPRKQHDDTDLHAGGIYE